MNKNYRDMSTAVKAIENGMPISREFASLTTKLQHNLDKTKANLYTATPLNAINLLVAYSFDEKYLYANAAIFGLCTAKWLADLTDYQKLTVLFKEKYDLK